MAGCNWTINEYNKSLTPEQRMENARRAGIASGESRTSTRICDIRQIAKMINEAPAGKSLQEGLSMLGIRDDGLTNAAGIALAVYQAAIEGDMKAVEKWERYTGQYIKGEGDDPKAEIMDKLDRMIEELKNATSERETD